VTCCIKDLCEGVTDEVNQGIWKESFGNVCENNTVCRAGGENQHPDLRDTSLESFPHRERPIMEIDRACQNNL
jgi:hypothetical protein